MLSSAWDNFPLPTTHRSPSNPDLKINGHHYKGPPGPACLSTVASDQFRLSAHRRPQRPVWGDCCVLFWRPQKPTGNLLFLKISLVMQKHGRTMCPAAGTFTPNKFRDRHLLSPIGFPMGSLGLMHTRRYPL